MLTKREFIPKNFFCLLLLPLLFIFSLLSAATVREDMDNIQTVEELQIYYEDNASNLYKARYIIKFTPKFLKVRGIHSVPAWFHQAVEAGLYSEYDVLIEESARACGKLDITYYISELENLFIISVQKYQSYAFSMRETIVNALAAMSDPQAGAVIHNLIRDYPKEYIENTDFETLLTFAPVISNPSDTIITHISKLRDHAVQLISEISDTTYYEQALEENLHRIKGLMDNLSIVVAPGGE